MLTSFAESALALKPFLGRLAQSLGLFLALTYVYWFFYKAGRYKGTLLRAALLRVRGWAYLLVFLLSGWWFLLDPQVPGRDRVLDVVQTLLSVVGAVLTVETTSILVFDHLLPSRRHIHLPMLLRSLVRGGAYALLSIFLVRRFWGSDTSTSLLTGSAVFSLILGLALQETLGNLFSGLAVDLSRPFRVGDWVLIGEREGRVAAIDWRATTLTTRNNTRLVIPNSDVAKQAVSNFTSPSPVQGLTVTVQAHFRHPPAQVQQALLACARDMPGVVAEPAPVARLVGFTNQGIEYLLRFHTNDYGARDDLVSDARRRIWYRFRRQGFDIPYAIGDRPFEREGPSSHSLADCAEHLKSISLFAGLTDAERATLAERVAIYTFTGGEVIFRQGDSGDALYLVCAGKVEVRVADAEGQVVFRTMLGPGDFFGEISLMTGAPRSATVAALEDTELLEVEKGDLRPLFQENPDLGDAISRALAERQEATTLHLADSAAEREKQDQAAIESSASQILVSIRRFFSY